MNRLVAVFGLILFVAAVHLTAQVSGSRAYEWTFSVPAPDDWETNGTWVEAKTGAMAEGLCSASWKGIVPDNSFIEVILDLPDSDALGKTVSASISLGRHDDPNCIIVSCIYTRVGFQVKLSGMNHANKKVDISIQGDTRPSAWLEYEKGRGTESNASLYPGWASATVSFGLIARAGDYRILLNGSECGRAVIATPAAAKLSITANGLTVRKVHISAAPPERYTYISGAGMAMLSGGLTSRQAQGIPPGKMQSKQIDVLGIPMVVQSGKNGIAVLDIGVEGTQIQPSGAVGILRTPVPVGIYTAAYLLLHDDATGTNTQPAMGFGLQPGTNPAGELKNIYIGQPPERAPDQKVNVRPVPVLGSGWYLAEVPLNPATLQWYTHAPDGTLLPKETPPKFDILAARPWSWFTSRAGNRSSLQLAAVALKESPMDLVLTGNGLGNVFSEPETPKLSATLRNLTDKPLHVTLRCKLIPFDRQEKTKEQRVLIVPNGSVTVNALSAPVRERGHYMVQVVAYAEQGDMIDYRTNLALLAPDTRKKVNSPFGIWSVIYGDTATETQRKYLKEKAGVGFFMDRTSDYFDYRMGVPMPDDAAAEKYISESSPDVKIVMLGWEHTWGDKYSFAFPGIISEGRFEEHTPDELARMDDAIECYRRIIRATRKLRPNAKISLGNSAVNYTVPLIERGKLKFGVDFDYFGTEEPMYFILPERWESPLGNVNWWTKAVCEHYGFHDVPIFHSESIYYSPRPGFAIMSPRTQAGNYVRTYLLGLPYNSIFGFSGAIIDSGNDYAYSLWGTAGYCNVAPECSPKPSFVAFATLTQMLDGAKYDGLLETGSTSVYALRFRKPDNSFVYALWNVSGSRKISVSVVPGGRPAVWDTFNRPMKVSISSGSMELAISDLPIYVTGAVLSKITLWENVPEPKSDGTLIAQFSNPDDWMFNADRGYWQPAWANPRVKGIWTITAEKLTAPPELQPARGQVQAVSFKLLRRDDTRVDTAFGLLAREGYFGLKPGKEIPIPKGTTRLGVWLYGRSTWGQVLLVMKDPKTGAETFVGGWGIWGISRPEHEICDNFDGWRLLRTEPLPESVTNGSYVLSGVFVSMFPQQVYVKDLRSTPKPELTIGGLVAFKERVKSPTNTYLPW